MLAVTTELIFELNNFSDNVFNVFMKLHITFRRLHCFASDYKKSGVRKEKF